MTKDKLSFMAACKDHFGMLPDQKPLEFGKELKQLTTADRKELAEGLVKIGYNIDESTILPKAVAA